MTANGNTPPAHEPHAAYHLRFDAYVPLSSEDNMRAYATPMTHAKPSLRNGPLPRPPPPPETPPPTTSAAAASAAAAPSTSRDDSPARQRAPPTPVSPTRGRFVQIPSSKAEHTQDYAYGLIHLYRDVSGLEDPDVSAVGRHPEEENTLAILAVPSYMTASDFMGFVGEQQKDQVSHFRMIRTEAANRYMVLLKFRTTEAAREFHSVFNGKAFNSMEVRPKTWF